MKRLKQNGKSGEKNIETVETRVTTDKNERNIFFVIDDRKRSKNEWILDSMSSYHMCPNNNLFFTYESCNGRIVLIRNNVICNVIDKGTV